MVRQNPLLTPSSENLAKKQACSEIFFLAGFRAEAAQPTEADGRNSEDERDHQCVR
jgi:hypothetical protein